MLRGSAILTCLRKRKKKSWISIARIQQTGHFPAGPSVTWSVRPAEPVFLSLLSCTRRGSSAFWTKCRVAHSSRSLKLRVTEWKVSAFTRSVHGLLPPCTTGWFRCSAIFWSWIPNKLWWGVLVSFKLLQLWDYRMGTLLDRFDEHDGAVPQNFILWLAELGSIFSGGWGLRANIRTNFAIGLWIDNNSIHRIFSSQD